MTYVMEGSSKLCKKCMVYAMGGTVKERVEKALQELRPRLQADGGDIELLEILDGVAKVRLKGACAGCPMSTMTLRMGVEQYLKTKIPEIVKVEAVWHLDFANLRQNRTNKD